LRAVETANLHGAVTVGLTGFDGGLLRKLASRCIHVASTNMQQVEDIHMILVHLISSALRDITLSLVREPMLTVDVEL
jgi:D-sedoheptulose 7-phosphate isomerase